MTPCGRTPFVERMTLRSLASVLVIAGSGLAVSSHAQLSSADSASACRSAIHLHHPVAHWEPSDFVFNQPAALVCTGLPPTADTLNVLEALVILGGNRDLLGQYALVLANGHLRVARNSQLEADRERGLASLRVAYRIKPLTSTRLLLSTEAAELALRLQESRQCSDVVRARELLAEARTVYPEQSVSHVPDWSAFELKAQETVKRVCGRQAVPQTDREPPQN